MMGCARLDRLLHGMGLVLAGVMLPVGAFAADGWLPVVVQTGNVGAGQYQPSQPVQPSYQPGQPSRQPAQRPRQPTPPVWRATGPAYMPGVPRAAQVARPTLTKHGLQMPAMPQGPQARPAQSNGSQPQAAADAGGAPTVVPPAAPQAIGQGAPQADAQERAVVFDQDATPTERAAAAVRFAEPVGAIPVTRTLSQSDSARLKVAATGAQPNAEAVTIPESDLAQRYCVNVTDAAADARMAWQKAKIEEAEKQLEQRIAALEAKTAEYKTWLARRDEFSRKANETLVQIYAQMEPDAGAAQLAAMDEETAASVLAKLDPQNSSAILNEMQPDKAARLTATIAGAARIASRRAAGPPQAQQQVAEQNADEYPAQPDADDPAAQPYQGGGR